jgi:uncharacterized membrane protein YeaQ/YmgE (transglycosylase-associated protein family)
MDILGAILSWVLCGLIVGLIARVLVPGTHAIGILGTIVLGIVGALLGGLIHRVVNDASWAPPGLTTGAWSVWIFAIIGAVLVLLLYTSWRQRSYWSSWRRRWW